MTLEFLDQWIEALRSGAFTQTKGSLRIVRDGVGECFCALGVGMEIVCKEHQDFKKNGRMGYQAGCFQFSGEIPLIPKTGFIEDEFDTSTAKTVTQLNDESKYSFNQIAVYLETYVRPKLQERLASHGEKTKAIEQRGEVHQTLAY